MLETELTAAGIPHDLKVYPGTKHAFFNDQLKVYHPTAAADSWQRVLAFFAEHVRRGLPERSKPGLVMALTALFPGTDTDSQADSPGCSSTTCDGIQGGPTRGLVQPEPIQTATIRAANAAHSTARKYSNAP